MKIDETKDIIVSVANKLFSRFGFQKTSMDEIAKTARKAKGSLYYHFASKEELFKEVVSREMSVLKNQLSDIVHNTELNAKDKIKNYLILRMQLLNNAANYHETLKADFYEHYIFIDDLRSEFDKWEIDNLRNILEQGINEGDFNKSGNIEVLLEMIIMVLKGLEIPFFLQNKYTRYSPYFDDLIGVLIKGISK
jgi:AcrR family transcriptional regulator